jgi:TRAP-type uncharacterized transport system substrate-binding protein
MTSIADNAVTMTGDRRMTSFITMTTKPALVIDRPVSITMQGDWGIATLHRVCGWLGAELSARSAPGTRVVIRNGCGFVDNVRAVGRKEVDLTLVAPAAFTRMALDGRGPYAGEAFPDLRAIGAVPQHDRFVVAVRKSLGISTFEQWRERKTAVRLATELNDGISHVGMARHEILSRSGIDVEGWGGELIGYGLPTQCLGAVAEGRADAIAHEAAMLPGWQAIGEDLNFLQVEDSVLAGVRTDYDWPDAHIPAGYFPGATAFQTLDFSNFLIAVRADMPDDLAYALAWILGETRETLEMQYTHIPSERSSLTYPLNPVAMGQTPIALHPGAARYYEGLESS